MKKIDLETILQLTRLCRINCTEEEQENLLKDLEKILAYIELLQEIDTEEVPPCYHVLEEPQLLLREDRVGAVLKRDDFLANAPSHIGGMIRVPPVIKQN